MRTLELQIKDQQYQESASDYIAILMCVDDAYDTLIQQAGSSLHTDDSSDRWSFAIFRHAVQMTGLIEEAINTLHRENKSLLRLTELPRLKIAILTGEDEHPNIYANGLISKGYILPQKDDFFALPTVLSNTFNCWEFFVFEGQLGNQIVDLTAAALKWVLLLLRKRLFENSLRFGFEVTVSDDPPLTFVHYPSELNLDRIEEFEHFTSRNMTDSHFGIIDWAADFKEAGRDASLTVQMGINSDANRRAMRREQEEILAALRLFPEVGEAFKERYGYSIEQLANSLETLGNISRTRNHTLYVGPAKKLEREIAKAANLPPAVARSILESLVAKSQDDFALCPIVKLGALSGFTLRRLMVTFFRRIDTVVSSIEAELNDRKGLIFENRCRDLLLKRGFHAFPTRLVCSDRVLPPDVSRHLWGHEKIGTDFDVIARKGNALLILECKEKIRPKSRFVHHRNLFLTFAQDLYWRTQWVAENRSRFESLIGDARGEFLSSVSEIAIIPIVVTTWPPENFVGSEVAVLTYSQLDRISKDIQTQNPIRDLGEYLVLGENSHGDIIKTKVFRFLVNVS